MNTKILDSKSINEQYTNLVNKTIESINSNCHFIFNKKNSTIIPIISTHLFSVEGTIDAIVLGFDSCPHFRYNIEGKEAFYLGLHSPEIQLQDLINILEILEKI